MSRFASLVNNGIQELRFSFCQSSATSSTLKSFVQTNYTGLKAANPTLPILVREAKNAQPKITARYNFGVEQTVAASNLSQQDLEKSLEELVAYGKTLPKSDESLPSNKQLQ